jgi:hypothetical protein
MKSILTKRIIAIMLVCTFATATLQAQFSGCMTQFLNDYAFCDGMCDTSSASSSLAVHFACSNVIAGCQVGAANAYKNCAEL